MRIKLLILVSIFIAIGVSVSAKRFGDPKILAVKAESGDSVVRSKTNDATGESILKLITPSQTWVIKIRDSDDALLIRDITAGTDKLIIKTGGTAIPTAPNIAYASGTVTVNATSDWLSVPGSTVPITVKVNSRVKLEQSIVMRHNAGGGCRTRYMENGTAVSSGSEGDCFLTAPNANDRIQCTPFAYTAKLSSGTHNFYVEIKEDTDNCFINGADVTWWFTATEIVQ